MDLVFKIAALIIALTLHEFMHGMAAFWLGDSTAHDQGRLSLNPLVHIDPFTTLLLPLFLILVGSPVVFAAAKPVPFKPWALRYGRWGAALVAIAGPATNITLAIFFALWMRLIPGAAVNPFLIQLVVINVAIGLFNLIPFPPLDGSRVLYAAAPAGLRDIMDSIERMGFIAIAIFIFFIYPYFSPLISTGIINLVHLLIPGAAGL